MFPSLKNSLLILATLAAVLRYCAANITVSQDGTGDYRTIQEAIRAAPSHSNQRFFIKIKAGTYREYVTVEADKTSIALAGDGMDLTRIVGNKSYKRDNLTTSYTATVGIKGHLFVAKDITFENDAGPQNYQAVALMSEADSAFYRCRFLGYQDTLYTKSGRQIYSHCHVYGTVDFIFGNANVVFQNSKIYARMPLDKQNITVTAQGRNESTNSGGTVIHRSTIEATPEFKQGSVVTYLGRPWFPYARVVIMQTKITLQVDPSGWIRWNKTQGLEKVYYAEYANTGNCYTKLSRKLTYSQAESFTVRNFIQGLEWIPDEIPFQPGLI